MKKKYFYEQTKDGQMSTTKLDRFFIEKKNLKRKMVQFGKVLGYFLALKNAKLLLFFI